VCENERSIFHSNSAKLQLLGQRIDKLVPSIDSNFSDYTVLLVELQFFTVLKLKCYILLV